MFGFQVACLGDGVLGEGSWGLLNSKFLFLRRRWDEVGNVQISPGPTRSRHVNQQISPDNLSLPALRIHRPGTQSAPFNSGAGSLPTRSGRYKYVIPRDVPLCIWFARRGHVSRQELICRLVSRSRLELLFRSWAERDRFNRIKPAETSPTNGAN